MPNNDYVLLDNELAAPDNDYVDLRATDCARSQTNEFVVDDYELVVRDNVIVVSMAIGMLG